jgi:hypothetical protein
MAPFITGMNGVFSLVESQRDFMFVELSCAKIGAATQSSIISA